MGQDNQARNNLDKALGFFLEAMRAYIPALFMKEHGVSWDEEYFQSMSDDQQRLWDSTSRDGNKSSEMMIDFGNLGVVAIKQKKVFRIDFGRDANNLTTTFNEIASARHMFAHYDDWDIDKADLAYNHMIKISKKLKMTELETELRDLKANKSVEDQIASEQIDQSVQVTPSNTAWFNNVKPHLDIRQGNLDESVFAADLAEVSLGTGRAVYQNHSLFFDKTYFTAGLTNIANRVIKGLNGEADGENRVISLQTGFGGGKTHTLISLYHLAKAGKQIKSDDKLNQKITEEVSFDKSNIAVFTNTTNDPTQGRKVGNVRIRTLWGELAYQLGGENLYNKIKPNDEQRSAPKGLFKDILEEASPCLILVDELADYCVAASTQSVGGSTLSDQTISFMQELTEAIAKTPGCVGVVTLPASVQEVANSPEAEGILMSLKDRVARVGADTKPVADDEIFEVIRHRLFEGFGDQSVTDSVLAAYEQLYTSHKFDIPGICQKSEYRDMMKRSYPFHPELINIFRNKWASNPKFQRTRGVLRILASIVSDLWKRKSSLVGTHTLIHPSHLELGNLDTLIGEIKKLYGNGYDAVVTSDVTGVSSNAYQIDDAKPDYGNHNLAKGVSSTIFLNSFGSEGVNKGISVQGLKLQLLVPDSFNHNSINSVLDELSDKAYYLYYSRKGGDEQRYWYHTKPNLNILVNKAKGNVNETKIEHEILEALEPKVNKVHKFKMMVNPSTDIPEQKQPTLIILHPSIYHNGNNRLIETISDIALKKGNSDRIYRNTMLFLSVSAQGKSKLYQAVTEYLSCVNVKEEYHTQLEQDQKQELQSRMSESKSNIQKELVTAYNQVHKHTASEGLKTLEIKQFARDIDIQISGNIFDSLKEEEWILEKVGYNLLNRNNLLPSDGQPIQTNTILEAFLRYDDKPMITSKDAVKESITSYMYNGRFALANGDGSNWSRVDFKNTLSMFDPDDITFYLLSESDYNDWVASQTPDPSSSNNSVGSTTSLTQTSSGIAENPSTSEEDESEKKINKIRISGNANAVEFNQLFRSFFTPLKDNEVEVTFTITAKSTARKELTENSQEYKVVKESASQLGYDFDEE